MNAFAQTDEIMQLFSNQSNNEHMPVCLSHLNFALKEERKHVIFSIGD